MAKSNAERQSDYRKRHLNGDGPGLARLNTVITEETKVILELLATTFSMSQRDLIENLVLDMQHALRRRIEYLPTGWRTFQNGELRMPYFPAHGEYSTIRKSEQIGFDIEPGVYYWRSDF